MPFNKKQWIDSLMTSGAKKSVPILSFPSVSLLNITVRELISDSRLQAEGMKMIAERCDTAASVSFMDLSVEAQAFGSDIIISDEEVPTVKGRLIVTPEDAENLKVPSVGAGRTGKYIEAIKIASTLITDRPVFAGVIGPFSLAGRLMDMSEIMVNCYDEPEMVHTTLQKTAEFITNYILAYKKNTGASGVVIAEPAAGLLSPSICEEFSSQYVKKIAESVKSDDFAVIYHNCGNVIPLIDSIKEIGADAYHFGNAIDLASLLQKFPAGLPVMGNISPSEYFRNGTPAQMVAKTKEVMEKCSPYPNFVPSSGCDIPPKSPWENIDAFFDTVKNFYAAK